MRHIVAVVGHKLLAQVRVVADMKVVVMVARVEFGHKAEVKVDYKVAVKVKAVHMKIAHKKVKEAGHKQEK